MVVDREAFSGSLRALLAEVAEPSEPAGVDLARLLNRAASATQTISAVDGAGLVLLDDDGLLRWVAVTSRAAQALEQAQHDLSEGPCLDAVADAQETSTADITADPRWPRLSRVLADQPVRGVLSIPVRLLGRSFGALSVHSSARHDWHDEEVKAVVALADVIADLLESSARAEEHAGRAAQLEHALQARVLIEQAKGVLIAREGLSGSEAFQRLRSNARTARRKVVDLAKEVMAEATSAPGASHLLEVERSRRIAAEQVAERLEQLQAVNAAFATALTTAEVAEVAVTQATAVTGAVAALVAVVAPGDTLEIEASSGLAPGGTHAPGGPRRERHIPLSSAIPTAKAVRDRQPIWLGSRTEHTAHPPAPTGNGAGNEAAAYIPLIADGDPVGVLALGYAEPRTFQPDEQRLIIALAAQCAQALERARRAEHSQWERIAAVVAQDRLAFLTEASGILVAALDPDSMLDQIARLAIPRVADVCLILLVDEPGQTLRPRVVSARDDATVSRARALLDRSPVRLGGAGIAATVAQSGRTRLLSVPPAPAPGRPTTDEPTPSEPAPGGTVPGGTVPGETAPDETVATIRALGVTSAIVAPLRGRSRVHGLLVLAGQREDLPYTEMDLTLAETLGRRIGVALETVPERTMPAMPNPRAEGA